MCRGHGYDYRGAAVFCSAGQNEKMGANGADDSRKLIAPAGVGVDVAGFKSGIFWADLGRWVR